MKKPVSVILIVASCFGVAMVANKFRFQYDWGNAFWRTLMTPFTDTVWASGFSEEGFAKIRKGMSYEQVAAILGEPLRRDCGNEGCSWIYSNQDTGTADYDRRWVWFDTKGYVEELRHEFYID